MSGRASVRRVNVPCLPGELIRRWPREHALLALCSGDAAAPSGRFSILATPDQWLLLDRRSPDAAPTIGTAWQCLDRALREPRPPAGGAPPLPGGWIGMLAYELGREIEPAARARRRRAHEPAAPLAALARIGSALIHDGVRGEWYAVGRDADALLAAAAAPHADGDDALHVGTFAPSLTPDGHLDAVQRVIDWIAAGDVFQVNVTQRLRASFRGSTRRLAAAALGAIAPRYGAYLELPHGQTLISMSPELFLAVDAATRAVITRPIKGTRPAAVDAAVLEDSEKDAAELHMIVDLMRNDLGRVCTPGSVRVTQGRVIESHATVHHGVAEIQGTLRADATIADLLAATFPPGSVTGAPKIRAMQIIEELEPVPREAYCGAIGWIGDDGSACLNVAIRTARIHGARPTNRWDEIDGVIDYGAGGGVVSDSRPLEEYREAMDKAAVLRLALERARAGEARPAPDVRGV